LTEETNPPATEDEATRATAEPPAMEPTPVADEAPETPTANAAADPDASAATAETKSTAAIAVEEPPAGEAEAHATPVSALAGRLRAPCAPHAAAMRMAGKIGMK